jgi:L,D-peptidoglycan transpeptidase YkuD (ErfK/YbiS/YcfS/YnhG family)
MRTGDGVAVFIHHIDVRRRPTIGCHGRHRRCHWPWRAAKRPGIV